MTIPSATSLAERADRLARKRALLLGVEVLLFVGSQGWFLTRHRPSAEDQAMLVAWAVALLLLMSPFTGLMLSRGVKSLLNDEASTAHRREGQSWGFWLGSIATVAVSGLSLVRSVSLFSGLDIVLAVALGAALGRYAWLEWRALRLG